MCGIAGVVRFDGAPVGPRLLRTMTERLAHRGPDGEGTWTDGPVALGHRRLSIIDLDGSPQPMSSADDRLHISFNGEILNYQALRRELQYPFRTGGDTETLLALFAQHGPAGINRAHGQFAFAIHDGDDGSLWLFRDRMGILPLYYAIENHQIVFASEIKALLPALSEPPRVDTAALASYLAHRSVPAPATLFEGVRELPAGHHLRVTPQGVAELTRWWTIPPVDTTLQVEPLTAVGLVGSALDASVHRNLVADVPVGAYLSGGVDSSLITALATGHAGGERVHTFAAGFADPALDEVAHARVVASHLDTIHHEVTVTSEDFERLWPTLTWHRDAPLSEPADVAVFRLAQLARQHVKVVLSGEGSDELFGGYPKHRFAGIGAWADLLPGPLLNNVGEAVAQSLPERLHRGRIALRALAAHDEAARLEAWFAPFTPRERAGLMGSDTRRPGADIAIAQGDALRRMLFADCHAWLADNLLERGDRMSMAASLELRPPFLDHQLVELAFSLPSNVKVRHGRTKWVIKEAARGLLPDGIIDRPKAGFRVPIARWMRGSMGDLAGERLLDRSSFVTTVFDRAAVEGLLASHRTGMRNEDIRIWTLLSLEVWYDQFRGEIATSTM